MKFTIKPELVEGAEGLPVFALTINDMAIHDAFQSECGRFPVDPTEAYGLTMDEALQLRELNAELTDCVRHAIEDRAEILAQDFAAGLVWRKAP